MYENNISLSRIGMSVLFQSMFKWGIIGFLGWSTINSVDNWIILLTQAS